MTDPAELLDDLEMIEKRVAENTARLDRLHAQAERMVQKRLARKLSRTGRKLERLEEHFNYSGPPPCQCSRLACERRRLKASGEFVGGPLAYNRHRLMRNGEREAHR